MSKVLTDIRIILRHLKKLPSDGTNSFKAHAVAQVRANMTNSNKEEVRALRWKTHDVAQMVTALKVRKELLDLYAGEKMSQEERIKLTAYKVGLRTPELYDAETSRGETEGDGNEDRSGAPDLVLERSGT